ESGRVDYSGATNEFIVTLDNAWIEDHDRSALDDYTQPLKVNTFGQIEPFRLSLDRYFGVQTVHQKLKWMTYGELVAERTRIERAAVPPGGEKQHARDLLMV